ncbi:MAG: hypothetical protein E5W49_00540 [Mesorhizobium sp.]|nr:MAG: hypothetical protein E5W49_00540 [Mesorhizobium sp.]
MDIDLAGIRLDSFDSKPSPLGSLVWSPGLLSRNGVRYLRCRTWRVDAKKDDLSALRSAKLELAAAFVSGICDDMEPLLFEMFGVGFFDAVVPVACGHSRRPNCLSVRIAVELAGRIGAELSKAFTDRFVSGSSHPMEFSRLPPLEVETVPKGRTLVVDDVATSGFHMHEALAVLRSHSVPAFGAVWLAGVRQE